KPSSWARRPTWSNPTRTKRCWTSFGNSREIDFRRSPLRQHVAAFARTRVGAPRVLANAATNGRLVVLNKPSDRATIAPNLGTGRLRACHTYRTPGMSACAGGRESGQEKDVFPGRRRREPGTKETPPCKSRFPHVTDI